MVEHDQGLQILLYKCVRYCYLYVFAVCMTSMDHLDMTMSAQLLPDCDRIFLWCSMDLTVLCSQYVALFDLVGSYHVGFGTVTNILVHSL